jgi:hypothetical protein
MRRRALALLLGAALLTAGSAGAQPVPERDPFLQQLAGSWQMTGTLMGKPVHQRGEGRWVLGGGWLCFTIIDQGVPPAYQAAVYIGFDAKAGDYIAHWLDQFGAAGARVVASGHRDGPRLVLTFPYADGAFRDTFVMQQGAARGTLLLESQQADGHWSTFASYQLRRAPVAATATPGR